MKSNEQTELKKKVGIQIHNDRMKGWRKEGLHSLMVCPKRTETDEQTVPCCENCEPRMLVYSSLPKSEKDVYDKYVTVVLKVLDEMGFVIMRKI